MKSISCNIISKGARIASLLLLFVALCGSTLRSQATNVFPKSFTDKQATAYEQHPANDIAWLLDKLFGPHSSSTDPSVPNPDLPENEDYNKEVDDDSNDDDFYITNAIQCSTDFSAGRFFKINQAAQCSTSVPLFILHHSWKSFIC